MEGLGLPKTLSKYEKFFDTAISKAWNSHLIGWNAIVKHNIIDKLQKISSKINIPGKVISAQAKPNKILFFKKMWVDINKLINMNEWNKLPVYKGDWLFYFFVTGFSNKEKANLFAQSNIFPSFKTLGITNGPTVLGQELTWRKEGLKVKLRLESSLILGDDVINAMRKQYANKTKTIK
jgi:hypothetical protein